MFVGSATVSTDECWPRTAYSAGTEAESQGSRGSVVDDATRSICSPSGSRTERRSSSGVVRLSVDSTPIAAKWSFHQPSEPSGTENAVEVDCPVPMTPERMPVHGKKVRSEPGRPASSP